jgi:hypothetical protein
MMADRIDVGDVGQVQEALSQVCHTLELALEHLCGSDVEKARRLFAETYLLPLYQLGFSLTLLLQRRVRKVLRSAIGPYLDPAFQAMAEALERKKPRFFEGLERPERGGERPFQSLADLRLTEEWLAQLEAQQGLFSSRLPFTLPPPDALDLSGCLPGQAADVTLSDFFLTALANRLLGRTFAPQPIAQQELPALHGRLCAAGRLADGLREETIAWLEALEPGAGAFGAYALQRWEEEFCPLPAQGLRPGMLGGLLVRLGEDASP